MNIDRNPRSVVRLLLAVPVTALALSLAACGASRPTEKEVAAGLVDFFADTAAGDTIDADAAACLAGYLVDSKISNETLARIAEGKDEPANAEDRDLTVTILTERTPECTG
ncbi:hypothetical protein [Streptomyces sp. AC495_CC817]|uniref:hypothetical protein n=1 Tax=Streptomyces sp. AC495_CC817 TaxID=2823900 RepID=UPI001C27EF41|nr:hypothetical protein [Streptomyces sp. AC495_CC817]